MIVDSVDIPVCKPCQHCGMPKIHQYEYNGVTRFSITCRNRCYYIGNETKNLDDAINAWNVLIAGVEKPPVEIALPYQVVKYDRKVQPIIKVAGITTVNRGDEKLLGAHAMRQIEHSALRNAYRKIAEKLCDEGIGTVEHKNNNYNGDMHIRVTMQVVDDR